MIKHICIICKKEHWIKPYEKSFRKYCSHKCYWKSKKGKIVHCQKGWKHSEKTKLKMSKIHKGKSYCAYWKGKKISIKTCKKISLALKGRFTGSDRWSWKNGKITQHGYKLVINPNRFNGDKRRYIREHRLIVEKYIGHLLKPKEEVHHLNENHSDNRKRNLMAFVNASAHQRFEKNPNNVKLKEIIFDGRKL